MRNLHCDWPTELIVLSAESPAGVVGEIDRLLQVLSCHPETHLSDLAYTLSLRRAFRYRAAVVAESLAALREKLEFVRDKADFGQPRQLYDHRGIFSGGQRQEGEIAFLFPGENSQYINMLGDLRHYFPSVRRYFDMLDKAFEGEELRPGLLLFPPEDSPVQDLYGSRPERLYDLDVGALSVLTANSALNALLTDFKIPCDALLGHSSGEYTALEVSETIRLKKETSPAKELKRTAGVLQHLMRSGLIPTGVVTAVGGVKRSAIDDVIRYYDGGLTLIMDNCPNQVVIFGDPPVVEDAVTRLQDLGGICVRLPFDRGYHSPQYRKVLADAPDLLEGFDLGEPRKRLYSCSTTRVFPEKPEEILACIYNQWCTPVRFRETIERMYEDGVRTFIEVGPSAVLTSFVNDILQGKEYTALPSNHPRRSGLEQLQYLFGALFVRQVPFDMSPLYCRGGTAACPPERDGTRTPAECFAGPAEDFRLQALKSHFELMREFLANQARTMELYASKICAGNGGPDEIRRDACVTKNYPLLGKALKNSPGFLKCEMLFDLEHDEFLRDHTFGRHLSRYDDTLTGLSLMPFAVSAEIAAEAAHCLAGGSGVVVSLANMKIYRWLALESGQLRLRVSAEHGTWPEVGPSALEGASIHVRLFEVSPSGDEFISFESDVKLAPKYSSPPTPFPFDLTGRKTYRWPDSELYRRGLFHGPTFQAVKHIRWWGEEGIEAEMEALSSTPLLRSGPASLLQTDPVLLDACGHLLAFWVYELHGFNHTFLPFQVKAIHLYSEALATGARVTGRAMLTLPNKDELEARMEVLDAKGRPLVRIEGWRDKRWIFHDCLYEGRRDPRATYFSEPWMASETGLIGRHISPAAQRFIEETSGLGRIVMAHSMLGRAERQFWYSLPERGPRRVEWLMGRIVAKDAVRKWAAGHLNLFLAAVDIEIRQTEAGKPFAVCPHIQQDVPDVSISHSGGHTIALLAAEGQRIGTDYQLIANIRACQLPDIAFSETEHLHLRHSGPFLRDRSIITLWSVKEAAAKAAGTGLEGRPKEWRIEEFSMEEGRATVVRNANTFSCRFWSTAEFVFSVCCY